MLHYVDHHSGCSYVAPLKNKFSKIVGFELLKILDKAVIPDMLQSGNSTEFLGKCIHLIRKYYKTIRIVKV